MKKILTLVMILAMVFTFTFADVSTDIDTAEAYQADSEFKVNLDAEAKISKAVITLSTSEEYAVDELWYKVVYFENQSEAYLKFDFNGTVIEKSNCKYIQSFVNENDKCLYQETTDIIPGVYWLHVVVYQDSGSESLINSVIIE